MGLNYNIVRDQKLQEFLSQKTIYSLIEFTNIKIVRRFLAINFKELHQNKNR
jgi:hypothetical protein